MAYATVARFKSRMGITDTTDDEEIGHALDEASELIDAHCHRSFGQSAPGTVRYYTPLRSDFVLIDDCVSLTAVVTDADGDRTYEDTWTATDYDLTPDNAAADGEPYDRIVVTPQGDYSFPPGVRKGLKLTGTWGWPATPARVESACLLQAARWFKRKDSPLGVMGSADLGYTRVAQRWLDGDVQQMLEGLVRAVVA